MKEIMGYGGQYFVTEDGRVWSKKNHIHDGLFIKPVRDKDGYLRVGLNDLIGRHRPKSVHRLVAQAYIPNPFGLAQVNHKNGVKEDNRIENLEWCSDADNKRHSREKGLHAFGERAGNAKLTDAKVRQILEANKKGELSHRELAEMFEVTRKSIRNVLYNITWKHIERKSPEGL